MTETMKPTQEEIEQYRQNYQAEVRRINDEPGGEPLSGDDLETALTLSDESIIDLIRQQVQPQKRAYIQMYYN
jgi:hypothetical protein